MSLPSSLPAIFVLVLAGCGNLASHDSPAVGTASPSSGPATGMEDDRATDAGEPMSTPAAIASRKLIRTGQLSVIVDEYAPLRTALTDRLDGLGGFVADSDLSHNAGRVSYATWVVRVPAEHFDELLAWTEAQAEVQSLSVATADVTARWTDVQARIDNNKRTERRLLELLESKTADLDDVLAVERELSRVRGVIEGAEGQMRVLADQVGLATLTVHISVRAAYEPTAAMAYSGRIGGAFVGSITAMVQVGQGLGIMAVTVIPWLLVLSVLGWLTFAVGGPVLRALRT